MVMKVATSKQIPGFELGADIGGVLLRGTGDWLITTIDAVDEELEAALKRAKVTSLHFDLRNVGRLDTSGAFLLTRELRRLGLSEFTLDGTDAQRTLMQAALDAQMGEAPREQKQWTDALARMGMAAERGWRELVETLAFLGEFVVILTRQAFSPAKVRWKSVVAQIETVGLDAAPIIMTLSFFIGAVIAFMGATLLANFGAQVFMVDLVGVTVLREFGVLITAIILAGRSASAFTAQIGAMKMRQEIDAMEVIGLDAFRALVIPRAVACVVSAPVLTFLAMMSGIFGGMLVAWLGPTDITPVLFFNRFNDVVTPNNFWVGLVKAPVFAVFIAVIGCRQGMAVEGNVTSLGTRTTSSVVQAIFSVIVLDAIFAVLFLLMDV